METISRAAKLSHLHQIRESRGISLWFSVSFAQKPAKYVGEFPYQIWVEGAQESTRRWEMLQVYFMFFHHHFLAPSQVPHVETSWPRQKLYNVIGASLKKIEHGDGDRQDYCGGDQMEILGE